GHVVKVLGDPVLEAGVRAAGCEFAPYVTAPTHNFRDRDADRVKDWKERNPIRSLARTTGELMFGPAEAYARHLLAHIVRFRPDALAADHLLVGRPVPADRP